MEFVFNLAQLESEHSGTPTQAELRNPDRAHTRRYEVAQFVYQQRNSKPENIRDEHG